MLEKKDLSVLNFQYLKSKRFFFVVFCFTAPLNPCCLLCPCRFKDSQTSVKDGDHYVIHENGTLEILVAQPVNSGKYTCIATNDLGIRENHVYLEVKGQIWTSDKSDSEIGSSTRCVRVKKTIVAYKEMIFLVLYSH